MSAAPVLVIVIAAALAVINIATIPIRRPTDTWDETPCRCGHDLYRHQTEIDRGACDRLGCQCQSYEP